MQAHEQSYFQLEKCAVILTCRPTRYDLSYDLRVTACRDPAMDYVSTDFGADCSSHFLFRVRTNRQIDRQMRLNALPHSVTPQLLASRCAIPKAKPYPKISKYNQFFSGP